MVLGPGDVGQRVVVRRRAGQRDGRPVYSDALGDLIAVDAAGLTVRTRKGPLRVPHGDVVAAKRIPPPRLGTAALERIASLAWPAAEQDRLGDWQLRATGGWTGRANSALTIGDPGLTLPEAFDAVAAWYAARGLPARCNVPLPLASAVDAALDGRGWTRSVPTLVQTAPLAALAGEDPAGPDDLQLEPEPSGEWLAAVAGWKGALPPAARELLTAPEQVRFASAYREGTLTGTARGAMVSGVLHLALVGVTAAARRQGLAGRLTRALAGWAREGGAHTAMLQVEETNAPAVARYAGLGFTTHHSYVTRALNA
jgi:ribosomal protein S18 acetylase RimI-like enzyme